MRQVDNVAHWGDILQLAVLELIRKVCRGAPAEKGRHMKTILALLQSTSTAVVYECAVTLVSLSQARRPALASRARAVALLLCGRSGSMCLQDLPLPALPQGRSRCIGRPRRRQHVHCMHMLPPAGMLLLAIMLFCASTACPPTRAVKGMSSHWQWHTVIQSMDASVHCTISGASILATYHCSVYIVKGCLTAAGADGHPRGGQLLLPAAGQPERQQRQAHRARPPAGAPTLTCVESSAPLRLQAPCNNGLLQAMVGNTSSAWLAVLAAELRVQRRRSDGRMAGTCAGLRQGTEGSGAGCAELKARRHAC